MKSSLLMDISINRETKTIHIRRGFDAEVQLVWQAWTTAELLDQWWAPRPYRNQTKVLDFRPGGHWLYAMISPEDQVHWCRTDFKEIESLHYFTALDAFCDESGVINSSFPRSLWKNVFSQKGDSTEVHVKLTFDHLSDLDKLVEMGFREGFTMGLQNLDELLETIKKK